MAADTTRVRRPKSAARLAIQALDRLAAMMLANYYEPTDEERDELRKLMSYINGCMAR